MVIDQATLCWVGGEEQSLLIRDWQPIPSSYSQTDGLRILMSCALYTFVNAELCAACKHNNTAPLQEYTGGIGPLTLLMHKLAQWEISWLFRCKMANRPPAQIFIFLAFGAGWPSECYHEFTLSRSLSEVAAHKKMFWIFLLSVLMVMAIWMS